MEGRALRSPLRGGGTPLQGQRDDQTVGGGHAQDQSSHGHGTHVGPQARHQATLLGGAAPAAAHHVGHPGAARSIPLLCCRKVQAVRSCSCCFRRFQGRPGGRLADVGLSHDAQSPTKYLQGGKGVMALMFDSMQARFPALLDAEQCVLCIHLGKQKVADVGCKQAGPPC